MQSPPFPRLGYNTRINTFAWLVVFNINEKKGGGEEKMSNKFVLKLCNTVSRKTITVNTLTPAMYSEHRM